MQHYFQWTAVLYPFIHRDSFMATLATLRHSVTNVRRTWLGILNIMQALAHNVSPTHFFWVLVTTITAMIPFTNCQVRSRSVTILKKVSCTIAGLKHYAISRHSKISRSKLVRFSPFLNKMQ